MLITHPVSIEMVVKEWLCNEMVVTECLFNEIVVKEWLWFLGVGRTRTTQIYQRLKTKNIINRKQE